MVNGRLMRSVALIFLLTSCSFFSTTEKSQSAKDSYTLPTLPKSWKANHTQQADYIFYGPEGSSLLIQSFCKEFQSPSLKNLAQGTFNSLDRAQITEQEEFNLQDRKALRSQGEAFLDGVKIHLTLVNTKRNNCYYDFLEVLPKTKTQSVINQVLKGIAFK